MQTDDAWEKWGKQDPYFGVFSQPKFRRNSIEEHRSDFFESGEQQVTQRLSIVRRLYGPIASEVAIDFGCGVGRLSIPLSRHYQRVIGVDISSGMIAEAKNNCQSFNVKNIDFVRLVTEIPENSADFINSDIVFQHIPVKRGLEIMAASLTRLRNGGVAALQVTTQRKLPLGKEIIYKIKHSIPGARVAFNIIQGKSLNEPLMQMNNYPIDDVVNIFIDSKMTDVSFLPAFGTSLGFIVMGKRQI